MTENVSPFGIFLITAIVGLLGLLGGLLLLKNVTLTRRWSSVLVSFAAGSMLGATFIDLLPETVEHGEGRTASVIGFVLVGIMVFFALEKLLVWHHHAHTHESPDSPHGRLHSARPLIIIGDSLHNFLDGIIIAIAWLADPSLGIVTAVAVAAHEIPQEIGDFGVLLGSGMPRKKVLLWNVISALISPIGALVGFVAYGAFESSEPYLLAFVVGNFIYIALADLIPAIQHERKLSRSSLQLAVTILGILVVWQLGQVLPH